MLSTNTKYGLLLLMSLLITMSCLIQPVYAAFNQTLSSGVQVTDTANSTTKNSETKITASVTNSRGSSKSNVITLKNTTSKDAILTFSYTFTQERSSGGISITSTGELSDVNNACSVKLATNGTVTITITAGGDLYPYKDTNTVVIDNIALAEVADMATVTFSYDSSCGSITAGGTPVTNGDSAEVTDAGIGLVATAANGCSFLGWIDESNLLLSGNTNYNLIPTSDCTIRAVFVRHNVSNAWFDAGNGHLYDNLNVAATAASSTTNKKVVPVFSGVLPAGDYTIPAGVTLLIPNDAANTVYTTLPGSAEKYSTTPSVYRTLTMAAGANITVNGAISVAGMQGSQQSGHNGAPRGPLGYIDMATGSKITVNSGGNLYAWGYIKGSGSVEILSGGTVYEDFQVMDWRGGTATLAMNDNTERVFPLSQYYVQNVEVPMTLQAGATEMVSTAMTISLVGLQRASVEFIGDEGMFRLTSGSFTKDYDEATDRLILDLNGDISLSKFELTMKLSIIGTKTFDSSQYTLPINNNITINVNPGSTATVAQDIAVLPGAKIVIAEGAKVTLGSGNKIFVYDANDWSNTYGYSNKAYIPLSYIAAPAGSTTRGTPVSRAADLSKDGEILINGIADASLGSVYTTNGGGKIWSTESGQLTVGVGTDTKTYQATQDDTDITYVEVAITPAVLQNGDGITPKIVATAGSAAGTTFYYHPEHQRWITSPHGESKDNKELCLCGVTNYSFVYSNQIGWSADTSQWYLKSNLYVRLGSNYLDTAALGKLKSFGVYFLVADSKPTADQMRESEYHYAMGGEELAAAIAEGDLGAMISAAFEKVTILTSDLADTDIYVMFYIVDLDSNGNDLECCGQVMKRNLVELAEAALEQSDGRSEGELAIYQDMTATNTAAAENQATFSSVPELPVYTTSSSALSYFSAGAAAELAVRQSASVVLIEPWGLRLNGYLSGTFDDYGLVILNDRDRTYRYEMPTAQQLMDDPKAQVYCVSEGSAAVNFGVDIGTGTFTQITTDYIGDLRAQELGNNIYVAFFVRDGDDYRFSSVQKHNVYLLCRQGLALELPETEKAVYLALIKLYHTVSDYQQ